MDFPTLFWRQTFTCTGVLCFLLSGGKPRLQQSARCCWFPKVQLCCERLSPSWCACHLVMPLMSLCPYASLKSEDVNLQGCCPSHNPSSCQGLQVYPPPAQTILQTSRLLWLSWHSCRCTCSSDCSLSCSCFLSWNGLSTQRWGRKWMPRLKCKYISYSSIVSIACSYFSARERFFLCMLGLRHLAPWSKGGLHKLQLGTTHSFYPNQNTSHVLQIIAPCKYKLHVVSQVYA